MDSSTKRSLARMASIALCGISLAIDIARIVQLVLDEREDQKEPLFDEE